MIPSRASAALLVLLAAAPAWARPSAEMSRERALLLDARDPDAAASFLSDRGLQARLRAEDEAGYLSLFKAAAELKDLRELLAGYKDEKRMIRDGLAARTECAFCQDVPQLLDWAARYRAVRSQDPLREALYEWDTLNEQVLGWLGQDGADRRAWEALPFHVRREKIRAAVKTRYDEAMKAAPKSRGELRRLQETAELIDDSLNQDESLALDARLERGETAVRDLAQAERAAAKSRDARLAAAVEDARGAPDLETRLAKLGALFDGLGLKDPALRNAVPMAPGTGFDASNAALLAESLRPELMGQVRGTWAGTELEAFYARHPLKITVSRERPGVFATYWQGELNLGQDEIENFLKARGRSVRDLLVSGPLLHELGQELAPTFVHEARHHQQDVWVQERGLRASWTQYKEVEAMETEALFVLEKSRRDPAYKKYLERSAKSSKLAAGEIDLAERLRDEGPESFRRSIRAWYYPDKQSLEAEAWRNLAQRQAESAEPSLTAVHKALQAFKAGKLQEFLDQRRRGASAEARNYAVHRARFDEVNRSVAARLKELESDRDPERRRRPETVPSPLAGGPR